MESCLAHLVEVESVPFTPIQQLLNKLHILSFDRGHEISGTWTFVRFSWEDLFVSREISSFHLHLIQLLDALQQASFEVGLLLLFGLA